MNACMYNELTFWPLCSIARCHGFIFPSNITYQWHRSTRIWLNVVIFEPKSRLRMTDIIVNKPFFRSFLFVELIYVDFVHIGGKNMLKKDYPRKKCFSFQWDQSFPLPTIRSIVSVCIEITCLNQWQSKFYIFCNPWVRMPSFESRFCMLIWNTFSVPRAWCHICSYNSLSRIWL